MAFVRKTWKCGDTVTAEDLNRIEAGIEEALECCGGGTETYTITLKVVGDNCYCEAGTVVDTITVSEGESVVLPDLGSCNDEGQGVDWYADEEETELVQTSGEPYTPTSDITLYASCPQE